MISEILIELKSQMQKATDGLTRELTTIRTGRATTALLDNIIVDYHGTSVQLQKMATISVPETNLIVVLPWDRDSLRSIEKAILKADIGLNPSNDGNTIRLTIPHLSEERRIELAKLVSKRVEERRIILRNIRRDYIEKLREMEKNKEISRNELDSSTKQVDKITESFIYQVNEIGQDKEKEIREV